MKKIIMILLILFVFLLSGCVDEGTISKIDEKTPADENIKAGLGMALVDRSDVYDGVSTGMNMEQVLSKFGEPTKKQVMESDVSGMMEGLGDLGVNVNTKMKMEMWYYGNVQITFTNGKVSGKMKV